VAWLWHLPWAEVSVVKVKDIMRTRDIATIRPEDNAALAAQIMLWSGVRHLPVMRGRQVVGVLSERDILRRSTELGPRAARVDSVDRAMTTPALTIDADKPLVAAAWLMSARKLGCLPVLKDGELVGIITSTDMVRHQFAVEAATEGGQEAPAPTTP
jgi:acetoin utilization protein AcuB